ncbi:hypothetical protein [Dethiosulfatarculus sandiegensis]|uniref:Uncharacterized protein n=1 Tax=Dethiosulfatarculus sandiegensis TaxID=1429043 RepID=A0A0D2JS58_9BACT|nr:hypothetical protein [Dethiosulfatarculus sandiegensis]KIX12350.1 hypothetical protein X474_19310 [Dethiosulfatarculus sandiegensis]
MPLGFSSQNSGRVAFGFFHIEVQMLLLNNCFFFARDFCELIKRLALVQAGDPFEELLRGWVIEYSLDMGELHGAIAGISRHGFLGDLYRRWPFPQDRAEFFQKSEGKATNKLVTLSIAGYGEARDLTLAAFETDSGPCLNFCGYHFDQKEVRRLFDYVWQGGMPGWENKIRPDYLLETVAMMPKSGSFWLGDNDFDKDSNGFSVD